MKRAFILIAALLAFANTAGAQTFYAVDSSEKVQSRSVTVIGSSTAVPIKMVVLSGDGPKFERIGLPLCIMLSPYKDSNWYRSFELDSVSAVSGDTLTISKRKLSNSQQLAWAAGTLVTVQNNAGVLIKQLQQRIGTGFSVPDTTGKTTKVLAVKAGGGFSWDANGAGVSGVSSFNTRTGAVVPASGDYAFTNISGTALVTQGGTGLSAITSGKLLYASASNTLAPLTLGTGLSITTGTLNVGLSPFSTTNLAEGTNLYYTDTRARAAITATSPVLISSGVISELQSTAITDGYLSAADWSTFNNKQNTLTLPLSIANGGTGEATAAAARVALLPDTTGHDGDVFTVSPGGGFSWTAGGGGGSGTVTSVALSLPAELSVSGSPVTTSGTLTGAWASELQNKVFAAPSGGNGTPTFRPLVSGDVPSLDFAKITTGVVPVAQGGTNIASYTIGDIPYASGTTTLSKLAVSTDGKVLTLTSGLPSWETPTTGTVTSVDVSGGSTGLTTSGGPITSTGTISLGGTLGIANGGTGQVTQTDAFNALSPQTTRGDIITRDASNDIRLAVGAANTLLKSDGTDLSYSKVILTTDVSGILPAANGGTANGFTAFSGPTTSTKTFTLPDASATLAYLAGGQTFTGGLTINGGLTLGTALAATSGGTAQSTWTTGDVLYASASNTLSKLGVGSTGQVLTVAAGVPSWATPTTGTVTSVSGTTNRISVTSPTTTPVIDISSSYVGQATITTLGTIATGVWNGTAIANANLANSTITLTNSDGSITIGSSPISLGGTGTVTLALANANTWTAAQTVNKANILTTYTDGLVLANNTASDAVNTVQQSPNLLFKSNVWNTTSVAANNTFDARVALVPTSNASPSAKLSFAFNNNGGGFTEKLSVTSAGVVTATTFVGALTGNASTATALQTGRNIYGNTFDGTTALTSVITSQFGGTSNGFTAFSGPTTTEKVFTLPNANATLAYLAGGQTFTGGLTINGGLTLGTALAIAQGGTGQTTAAAAFSALSPITTTGDIIYSSSGTTASRLAIGTTGYVLTVAGGVPTWAAASGGVTNSATENVLAGTGAGAALSGSSYNTFFGYNAGNALTNTNNNSAFGAEALLSAVTTYGNTAVGMRAGKLATNDDNTFIGANTGRALTTGNKNTFVGGTSGMSFTTGAENTTLGYQSGYGVGAGSSGTGARNTFIGASSAGASASDITGSDNTTLGYQSAKVLTSATDNVLIGKDAALALTTSSGNVAIGRDALKAVTTTGTQAVAVGYQALKANTTGSLNTAVGYQAGATIVGGNYNTLFGWNAGTLISSGSSNTCVGLGAGATLATTSNNTFVGYGTGNLSTGADNTALGYNALDNITSANDNVGVGSNALLTITTGTRNVAVGKDAGKLAQTSNSDLTLLGYSAGSSITTGTSSTLVGSKAGDALTSGGSNVAIGLDALGVATTSASNVVVGTSAGTAVSTGSGNNVIVGASSAGALTTGAANVMLGSQAGGAVTTGGGNIFLGAQSGGNSAVSIANTFVAGSDNYPTDNVFFGKGDLSATATAWTLSGTGGLGADKVGGDLTLAGGPSTGTGTVGNIIFKTSTASSTSSTQNAGAEVARFTSTALKFAKAVNYKISAAKTSNYTLTTSDCVVPADANGGAITMTLPSSPDDGQMVTIVKSDNSINAVTVGRGGNDFVGLAADITLASQGSQVTAIFSLTLAKWIRISVI